MPDQNMTTIRDVKLWAIEKNRLGKISFMWIVRVGSIGLKPAT